jgi:hypothetical protein
LRRRSTGPWWSIPIERGPALRLVVDNDEDVLA